MRRFAGFVLISMLFTAVVFVAVPAFAMPLDGGRAVGGGGGDMEMRERLMDRMLDELDLSVAQKKALEEHRKAHRESAKGLFESMKDVQEKLAEELERERINRGAVDKLAAEMKRIQGRLIDHRIEGVLKVREILTPTQFKAFSAKIKELRNEQMERRRDKKQEPPVRGK